MTFDISTLFLALGVVFGAIVAILQARMTTQYAALARKQRESERVEAFVAAILTAWAEHWGEPPDQVKPILLQIVHDPRFVSPPVKPPPPELWVGSDGGLISILIEVRRRLHALGS